MKIVIKNILIIAGIIFLSLCGSAVVLFFLECFVELILKRYFLCWHYVTLGIVISIYFYLKIWKWGFVAEKIEKKDV